MGDPPPWCLKQPDEWGLVTAYGIVGCVSGWAPGFGCPVVVVRRGSMKLAFQHQVVLSTMGVTPHETNTTIYQIVTKHICFSYFLSTVFIFLSRFEESANNPACLSNTFIFQCHFDPCQSQITFGQLFGSCGCSCFSSLFINITVFCKSWSKSVNFML